MFEYRNAEKKAFVSPNCRKKAFVFPNPEKNNNIIPSSNSCTVRIHTKIRVRMSGHCSRVQFNFRN